MSGHTSRQRALSDATVVVPHESLGQMTAPESGAPGVQS